MISRPFASREVARMSGLEYFGALDAVAVEELVTALAHADSEIIAVATVNEWLASQARRPTPADLRRILARHNGHHAHCVFCCDTGLLTETGVFERCACVAGDLKSATDWAGTKIHPRDRVST